MKGASDEGYRHGAGDENRTRMTSLEVFCTAAYANVQAPTG
jgi:hypothetical protein